MEPFMEFEIQSNEVICELNKFIERHIMKEADEGSETPAMEMRSHIKLPHFARYSRRQLMRKTCL